MLLNDVSTIYNGRCTEFHLGALEPVAIRAEKE
jgi:hypothetical protein